MGVKNYDQLLYESVESYAVMLGGKGNESDFTEVVKSVSACA